ncbi:MAG: polysaccharide biosynthesis C-terminal domain-containing protein [Ignavibacteriales bacterium]|nr:polysaccharide biosynthesis C-terminal domain-containing protein [Ignavibacteriales bacterium]
MPSPISLGWILKRGQYALYIAAAEKAAYFAVFVSLARLSSVADYGRITAAFAFVNILVSVFELGLGPYFQRAAASGKAELQEELNSATGLRIALFVPFIAIVLMYFNRIAFNSATIVLLISLTVYVGSISGIFARVLYGADRYAAAFKALVISKMLIILLVGGCFLLQASPVWILGILFAGIVLQLLLMIGEMASIQFRAGLSLSPGLLRHVLASSTPIGIGLMFVWIYDKADVLLIQRIIGSEAVSYYAVAYSLYKIPQTVAGVLLLPLFSEVSARFSTSSTIDFEDLLKPAGILLGFSAVGILIYNIFPDILLSLTYGRSYGSSGWILAGLSFALPGLLLNNLTGITLNAMKRERLAMTSAMLAFMVNMTINIVFLRWMGIFGAMMATVCTEFFILGVQIIFLYRTKQIRWRTTIFPITMHG